MYQLNSKLLQANCFSGLESSWLLFQSIGKTNLLGLSASPSEHDDLVFTGPEQLAVIKANIIFYNFIWSLSGHSAGHLSANWRSTDVRWCHRTTTQSTGVNYSAEENMPSGVAQSKSWLQHGMTSRPQTSHEHFWTEAVW